MLNKRNIHDDNRAQVTGIICIGAKVFKGSRLILLLLLLVILSLLTGCAIIDSSNLESAQNLEPGRVKMITYQGAALSTHRMLSDTITDYDTDDDIVVYDTPDIYYSTGFKFGVGLTQRDEIDLSALLPNCYKLAWKHRFTEDSLRVQLALMPAVSISSGDDRYIFLEGLNGQYEKYFREYNSRTIELPLLVTIARESISMTACFKAGYNHISYTDYWREDTWEHTPAVLDKGTFDTVMVGLILTPRIKLSSIVLIPEAGLYYYRTNEGNLNFVPVWNLGLGLDFGRF